MIKYTLLIFIILESFIGLSQVSDWMFDKKSIRDGLSNTYVTDIIKDSKGFIWTATKNGLNRYNAYSFEIFKHNSENNLTLSSDQINCVHEDSKGRIWIGTINGLNQYDNLTGNFISWLSDSTKLNDQRPHSVQKIVEDKEGILWIGTATGIIRFDPEKELFEELFLNSTILLLNKHPFLVRSLFIDDLQNLWIGTNGYGILRYSIPEKTGEFWRDNNENGIATKLNYCFALFQDKKGAIWAGSFVGGLSKLNRQTNQFENIYNPYNPKAIMKNGVLSINEDSAGNLLVGSNGGGLFIFDRKTNTFKKNYRFSSTNENSVGGDFISKIFIDETDILWLGTENGGVSIYDPNRRKFDLYKKDGDHANTLSGNIVNTLFETKDGKIWIGTENNGYSSLDKATKTYKSFRLKNGKTVNGVTFIKTIISDGKKGLWIGAHMGGLAHADEYGVINEQYAPDLQPNNINRLMDTEIRNLLLDADSNLWIGGYRGLYGKNGNDFKNYCYSENLNGNYCNEIVNVIFEYDETYLIIGYGQLGIRFFNKKTRQFESSFTRSNSNLSSNQVYSIHLDSKNRLWVGTVNGLNQFHFNDSTFTSYSKKDGLPDNSIFGVLEDNQANLWISTRFGLSCFNPSNGTFKNYFEADGLQSNVFREGAYHKSKSGELFFGGVAGFNAFYPDQIKSNPNPPPVVFTSFQLFNKPVVHGPKSPLKSQISHTKSIELDYNQSTFSFEFAALNYTLSEKNEYAYMLEGFDEDWQYIGSRRHITFTNISAGNYIVRVKACNNDGLWNESGASIEIIINPPFWETWWFRLLIFLLGLIIIYGIYKWRIRAIKNQNKLLEKEVKIRTKQVVEQKNEIASQKDLVEQKNNDITSSIRYAKRIQDSFLPDFNELKNTFADSFVFFKPKDIVSGDFYWIEPLHITNKIILAVGDCTGHGVPGAMVSILGNNGLNRSIKELNIKKPNAILDNLNTFIKDAFDRKDSNVQDGMDIALCSIDTETNNLQYSGAHNPVWIAREGEMIVLKGTKQPIGNYRDSKPFELKEFQLKPGDWLFLFSDGYPDQFGGPKGKKYKYAKFQKTLLDFDATIHGDFTMYLNKDFDAWKGELEQLDDVCVFGIKIC